MKENNRILQMRLAACQSELARAHNELAKARGENDLLRAENESLRAEAVNSSGQERISELVSSLEAKDAECEKLKGEIRKRDERISELEEAMREKESVEERLSLLEEESEEVRKVLDCAKEQNVDLGALLTSLLRRHYLRSSEATRFLANSLDDLSECVQELGMDETMREVLASAERLEGKGKALTATLRKRPKRKTRKASPTLTQKRNTAVARVAETIGINMEGMPKDAKIIMRKEKEDTWTVRLFFYKKAKVYSKVYKIGRFNVPGSDPMNSNYPQSVIKGNPLMPSFCRFYLESKFAYHLSESRILSMLKQMGMSVPQSTLNRWMQQIEAHLRERLGSLMMERLRQSVYTQNDEVRIKVRCRGAKGGEQIKYHTRYIHAALSMEAKLCVMEYREGSRDHTVQEEAFFKGSKIKLFTADRFAMYGTIQKDIDEILLDRTACWAHARRKLIEILHLDPDLAIIIKLINLLFLIERESKAMRHSFEERYRYRLRYSAKVVAKLMRCLKVMQKDPKRPKPVLKAINYVLDDEKAFTKFLDNGMIEMHNNNIERMFRHLAMGRRNWLHTGSHGGAENIAFMFSLYESCSLNGLDFGDYIEDVLTRMMNGETDDASLIPCNYVRKETTSTDVA